MLWLRWSLGLLDGFRGGISADNPFGVHEYRNVMRNPVKHIYKSEGGIMKNLFLILSFILILTGCSIQKEQQKKDLASEMDSVINYKLNAVEAEHAEKVNQWLAKARDTGEVGQYFIYQDGTNKEDLYSYVYRKGYIDYEVSFIYNPSDPNNKGKIHVTGLNKDLKNDNFVQIKSMNDLSILFILSDESLKSKLKD
ncbi:hypothetical protein [Paenibacillus sp. OK060]|nr:hypothetical protein [Paenibacillus sp. OK060]